MKEFKYRKAEDINTALAILAEEKENAYVVAGASNCTLDIRSGWLNNRTLVDINAIPALRGITMEGDTITVGPNTTISDLEFSDILIKHAPVLHEVSRSFADPSTRHTATVGGNICNASPAADCAAPLLVLDAVLTIEKKGSKREVPIDQFFIKKDTSVLEPDELLTKITFKAKPRSGFHKMGSRKAMSISAANFAVAMEVDGGKAKNVRVATGCLSPFPTRARKTEELLEGKQITDELLAKVDEVLNKNDINPHSGMRSTEAYRRQIAPVYICRLLKAAFGA